MNNFQFTLSLTLFYILCILCIKPFKISLDSLSKLFFFFFPEKSVAVLNVTLAVALTMIISLLFRKSSIISQLIISIMLFPRFWRVSCHAARDMLVTCTSIELVVDAWHALPWAHDSVLACLLPSFPNLSSEVPSVYLSFLPTRTHNPLSSHSLSMSSTEHTTISPSNLQLIIDALGDYAHRMGIDFAKNPFAEELQHTNTPNDILNLLQQRENAFIQYRNRNRKLVSGFSQAVRVLHIFSEKLGHAVTLVSFTTYFVFFIPM